LKIRASEVVRAVKENRSRYVITLRGKPAALLIPIDADYDRDKVNEVWGRLHNLREEVGKGGQNHQRNSLDIIEEMRK
jgi:prevent-host-death family protein